MRFLVRSCGWVVVLGWGSLALGQAQTKRLTVEESVAIAWKQSPLVKAAGFAREAGQALADHEKPVVRPKVEIVASRTVQGPRVTFPRSGGADATVLPESVSKLDVILEQTFYRGGAGAVRRRYTAQSELVELDYRKALGEVAWGVQKAYWDVWRGESGVRVAREGLETAKEYQTLALKQIEVGRGKPVDALTVAGHVAEAQAGLSQAENGLSLARLAFNRALGRPLTTPVALEAKITLPVAPANPDAAVKVALQNRVELLAMEQNLVSANAGVTLAQTQSQPTVSLRGQLTEQTPSAFVREHYLAATLEFRWPLLDGGKTRLDTREAKAQAQRLAALREDARQGVVLDVTQAWQKMQAAQEQIRLATTQREGAEATAKVAVKAYEVERGTALEVQAAQREVRLARERELQAQYDLHIAALEFQYAQGLTAPSGEAVSSQRVRSLE